jgi:hypothetical protein
VADELNPRQMWEIVNKLEALDKKLDRADTRVEGLVQALDGVGQQPGIRQQLRELKHAVEGNPPSMRGVVLELVAMNEEHAKLRREFEAFVKSQNTANDTRQGTIVGAKTMWGFIAGAVAFLGTLFYLLMQIQNALSRGGS